MAGPLPCAGRPFLIQQNAGFSRIFDFSCHFDNQVESRREKTDLKNGNLRLKCKFKKTSRENEGFKPV